MKRLAVSGAVRPLKASLSFKGLILCDPLAAYSEMGSLRPAVPPGELNNLQEALEKYNLFKYVEIKH
jgi:hypothetical protein